MKKSIKAFWYFNISLLSLGFIISAQAQQPSDENRQTMEVWGKIYALEDRAPFSVINHIPDNVCSSSHEEFGFLLDTDIPAGGLHDWCKQRDYNFCPPGVPKKQQSEFCSKEFLKGVNYFDKVEGLCNAIEPKTRNAPQNPKPQSKEEVYLVLQGNCRQLKAMKVDLKKYFKPTKKEAEVLPGVENSSPWIKKLCQDRLAIEVAAWQSMGDEQKTIKHVPKNTKELWKFAKNKFDERDTCPDSILSGSATSSSQTRVGTDKVRGSTGQPLKGK